MQEDNINLDERKVTFGGRWESSKGQCPETIETMIRQLVQQLIAIH